MQVQPLNPIPSYYAKHGIPMPNQQDNVIAESAAYDVSISVDKSLRNQYSNMLSSHSNAEGNAFELMKDGYAKLLGEINQKYADNQDEKDKNIKALDVAFKSSISIRATMRDVILSHNAKNETTSQGLQLQQEISKQSDYDNDSFAVNTTSTLANFADKFIEFTKSGGVDNAWSKAIDYFSGMETTSVNKLSLTDMLSLFSDSIDSSKLSPLMKIIYGM